MSTLTELFTNIANAIRNKKGTSEKIKASDFPGEIENLSSGGSSEYNVLLQKDSTSFSVTSWLKNLGK